MPPDTRPDRAPLDVITATLVNAGIDAHRAYLIGVDIITALFDIDALPLNPAQRAAYQKNMTWALARMQYQGEEAERAC